ncbi:MAG: MSCRAMM family adhesin SdrC [Caldilineaceae bacterium]|nr:MSCRAMM family adhesin SdrC [Caldilineaceae bacterium]
MIRAFVGATRLLFTATISVLLLYGALRMTALGATSDAADPSPLPLSAIAKSANRGPVASARVGEIQTVHAPAIVITASVGLNPHQCATSTAVTVTAGVEVTFCYLVANTGDVTFTDHHIVDPALGLDFLLPDEWLTPVDGVQSAFFLTVAKELTTSALHHVTWTATNATGDVAVAEDSTRVIVPTVRLTHTVGLDPHTCAITNTVTVMANTMVTHCFQVENTSDVTFSSHRAANSSAESSPFDWLSTLEPGATLFLTATELVTTTTSNIFTWTAFVSDHLYAVATDQATLFVPAIDVRTTVGDDPANCADTDTITATVGVNVTYCYYVFNVGGTPLTRLLVDDLVLDAETIVVSQTLAENNWLWFLVTAPITQTTVNTVTWTALTAEGLAARAADAAYVHALSWLSATAFYDVDRDGIQSPMEYGVESITVTLDTPMGVPLKVATDDEGAATFHDLVSGQYTVTITTRDLDPHYTVAAADRTQVITVTEASGYTATIALWRPDETDSDGDGIPDYIEGIGDIDDDGHPDYLDPDQYLFLPLVRR